MKYTIFTPTYNRADLLPRVYESLLNQQEKDFEWLIVDDGSADSTEAVVSQMISERKLVIRYIRKENGGKHTAHNTAMKYAEGELFMCLDSDDMLADDALITLNRYKDQLHDTDCGLLAKKVTLAGKCLSGDIQQNNIHYGLYGYTKHCSASGEYTLVFLRSVICCYQFPEISCERFVTECVLYDKLELDGYTLAVVPEILQVCEYQEDGLTRNIYQSLVKNPVAYQIYHMQRVDLVYSIKERVRHAVQYQSFKRMSRNSEYRYSGKHRLLVKLMYPMGILGALYYNRKFR